MQETIAISRIKGALFTFGLGTTRKQVMTKIEEILRDMDAAKALELADMEARFDASSAALGLAIESLKVAA